MSSVTAIALLSVLAGLYLALATWISGNGTRQRLKLAAEVRGAIPDELAAEWSQMIKLEAEKALWQSRLRWWIVPSIALLLVILLAVSILATASVGDYRSNSIVMGVILLLLAILLFISAILKDYRRKTGEDPINSPNWFVRRFALLFDGRSEKPRTATEPNHSSDTETDASSPFTVIAILVLLVAADAILARLKDSSLTADRDPDDGDHPRVK